MENNVITKDNEMVKSFFVSSENIYLIVTVK
jgi:hypothetical protein